MTDDRRVIVWEKCEVCGQKFERTRKGHRYCSALCRSRRLYKITHWRGNGKDHTCAECGKTFTAFRKDVTCCSKKCSSIKYRRDNLYALKTPKEEHICPICKKHFMANRKDRIYCGKSCATLRYRMDNKEKIKTSKSIQNHKQKIKLFESMNGVPNNKPAFDITKWNHNSESVRNYLG